MSLYGVWMVCWVCRLLVTRCAVAFLLSYRFWVMVVIMLECLFLGVFSISMWWLLVSAFSVLACACWWVVGEECMSIRCSVVVLVFRWLSMLVMWCMLVVVSFLDIDMVWSLNVLGSCFSFGCSSSRTLMRIGSIGLFRVMVCSSLSWI